MAARMGDVVDGQTDTVPTHSDVNYSAPSFAFVRRLVFAHGSRGGCGPSKVGLLRWEGWGVHIELFIKCNHAAEPRRPIPSVQGQVASLETHQNPGP